MAKVTFLFWWKLLPFVYFAFLTTVICFFCVGIFCQAQKRQNFFIENLTWRKFRKRGRWPTTSISFVLFTYYCLHLFVYMLASNGISTLSIKFRAWNIIPSENFRDEIFSSENVSTKIFHMNYLELKLMRTKIKQIMVCSVCIVHTFFSSF